MALGKRLRNWRLKGRSLRRLLSQERVDWADVEHRLRRRMRVYPNTMTERDLAQLDVPLPAGGRGALDWDSDNGCQNPDFENERRRPIISIHGRDIAEDEHVFRTPRR